MNAPVEAGLVPYVVTEVRDGVCTVTMNRGDRFNPLSTSMIAALDEAFDAIAADANARVVVLTGAGRAFCAGHDLTEMRAHIDHAWQRALFDAVHRDDDEDDPIAAAGDRARAGRGRGGRLPARVDVRSRRGCGPREVRPVRHQRRDLLHDPVGRRRAQRAAQARDGALAHRASSSTRKPRSAWGLVNRVVPVAELDAAVAALAQHDRAQERARGRASASARSTRRSSRAWQSAYDTGRRDDGLQHAGPRRRRGHRRLPRRSGRRSGAISGLELS